MKTKKQLLEQISRHVVNFNINTDIECSIMLNKSVLSIYLYSETLLFSEFIELNREETITELEGLVEQLHSFKI